MPYSIVHLEVANEKIKKLNNISENDILDFLVGNIIVDSSYNLKSLGEINIKRVDTHYHKGEDYFSFDFPKNFYEIEIKKDPANYIKYGYYYHLLVDELWKNNFVDIDYSDIYNWCLYQKGRKIYAHKDLENFIKNNNGQDIIDKLYNYKIKKEKLPGVFKDISQKNIEKNYLMLLDQMTKKDDWDELEGNILNIEKGKRLEDEINRVIDYQKYLEFKNNSINIDFRIKNI